MALLRWFFLLIWAWPALAIAQWVKVDTTDPAVIYADPVSRQIQGHQVKMWELVDYRKPQVFAGASFRSSRVLREFDCQKREMRTLAFTIFGGPMAQGEVIHSHRVDHANWALVEPYSVGEASFKLACQR